MSRSATAVHHREPESKGWRPSVELIGLAVGLALQTLVFAFVIGQQQATTEARLSAVESATAPLEEGKLARLEERADRLLDAIKALNDRLDRRERR